MTRVKMPSAKVLRALYAQALADGVSGSYAQFTKAVRAYLAGAASGGSPVPGMVPAPGSLGGTAVPGGVTFRPSQVFIQRPQTTNVGTLAPSPLQQAGAAAIAAIGKEVQPLAESVLGAAGQLAASFAPSLGEAIGVGAALLPVIGPLAPIVAPLAMPLVSTIGGAVSDFLGFGDSGPAQWDIEKAQLAALAAAPRQPTTTGGARGHALN